MLPAVVIVLLAGLIGWLVFHPTETAGLQRQLDATRDSVRTLAPRLQAASKQLQEVQRTNADLRAVKDTLWTRLDSVTKAPKTQVTRRMIVVDTTDMHSLREALTATTLDRDLAEAQVIALQSRLDAAVLVTSQIRAVDSAAYDAQQQALSAIRAQMDTVRTSAVNITGIATRSKMRRVAGAVQSVGSKLLIAVVFYSLGARS